MNKTIAGAAMAASLAAGGMAGMVLGAPGLAGAQTAATDAVNWVDEALGGLVSDGTITQAQADAVETALDEARPERGRRKHGGRHLDTVAEALGVTEDDLRAALDEGQTIAEVAQAQGVDVQAVIDAFLTSTQERLGDKVAAGDITQAEADERLAKAEERATAMVNGDMSRRGGDRPGRGPRGGDDFATEDAPS